MAHLVVGFKTVAAVATAIGTAGIFIIAQVETQAIGAAVIGGLVVLVPVLGTWVINLWRARGELSRTARQDALAEWQGIVDRQQSELDAQKNQLAEHARQLFQVMKAEADCQKSHGEAREKLARQTGIIEKLTEDVRRMQAVTGTLPPGVSTPATITVNLADGIIMACNPVVGPLFGWTPDELVGQNVEVLVPAEHRPAHDKGFRAVMAGKPPRTTSFATEGLHRSGRRVPVVINLSQPWKSPRGSVFLNAEIRGDFPNTQQGQPAPFVPRRNLPGDDP